jgi:hypothetical protein
LYFAFVAAHYKIYTSWLATPILFLCMGAIGGNAWYLLIVSNVTKENARFYADSLGLTLQRLRRFANFCDGCELVQPQAAQAHIHHKNLHGTGSHWRWREDLKSYNRQLKKVEKYVTVEG